MNREMNREIQKNTFLYIFFFKFQILKFQISIFIFAILKIVFFEFHDSFHDSFHDFFSRFCFIDIFLSTIFSI